ncbi:MAG: hypothetical protein LBQ56_02240 [Synergistaceae bacterium]|jgi:hypothetical protein|nr:hypothetical protein [Synergistaceae bacterium]
MKKLLITSLVAVSLTFSVHLASAIDLKDILKDGAIIIGGGAVVKALGPQIDSFINTITFNKNAKFEGYTKVVPIISLGNGAHIGAAQVGATSKAAVDRTKAVAQLEGDFQSIRARALIPVDSENPIQQFRRVQGVGVTAIIDVKL